MDKIMIDIVIENKVNLLLAILTSLSAVILTFSTVATHV